MRQHKKLTELTALLDADPAARRRGGRRGRGGEGRAYAVPGRDHDGAASRKIMEPCPTRKDRESSVVFGMRAAAVRLHAAMHVLSPDRIAKVLCGLVGLTASLGPSA